jgi:hypothetical protein
MKAVKDGSEASAHANGVWYRLTIEREEPSPPKPIFVVRTIVDSDEETGADGVVTSVVVNKVA